jgi:hypothetical protein
MSNKPNKIQEISDLACGCYSITERRFDKKEELDNVYDILNSKIVYDYKCLQHNHELKRLKRRLSK